jgi:tripeptide aminopeptidase
MPGTSTLKTSVLERFLRYVQFDTQSDPSSTSVPSTPKQLVMMDALIEELKALGLTDAKRDEYGIVMATLPANTKEPNVPVIGLLAHVDTSPELSGANVKPIVHRNWDGRDIVLPTNSVVLRVSEIPELDGKQGEDIVTASGDTLLGADDKSGVAVVMAAIEQLRAHPEITHGAIRVSFTPDEEIGRGVRYFDTRRFGAVCAYTLDGEGLGRLETETFSADAMQVTFQGFNTHPGFAHQKMVNSIKVAADFIDRLPKDGLGPETTSVREGFVHPMDVQAAVDRTTIKFIIRDFRTGALAEHERFVEDLARATTRDWPGSSYTIKVEESYRNMLEVLEKNPNTVEFAREAIRRAGMRPESSQIRGGTDGSILSEMGLPTPNLSSGQHNFHSRLEWVSAQDMEKAVDVLIQLAQVWEERG